MNLRYWTAIFSQKKEILIFKGIETKLLTDTEDITKVKWKKWASNKILLW